MPAYVSSECANLSYASASLAHCFPLTPSLISLARFAYLISPITSYKHGTCHVSEKLTLSPRPTHVSLDGLPPSGSARILQTLQLLGGVHEAAVISRRRENQMRVLHSIQMSLQQMVGVAYLSFLLVSSKFASRLYCAVHVVTCSELRNHIYEFALEDHMKAGFAPCVNIYAASRNANPWAGRLWAFFALCQVCRQVRSEYRPLWLSNLSIRTYLGLVASFDATFLSGNGSNSHAPKLVQIEYDHNNTMRKDITPLVALGAQFPMLKISFVPHKLSDGGAQEEDICDYCIENIWADDHGLEEWLNMYDECTCADPDLNEEDWKGYHYGLIRHTIVYEKFLHNDNRNWMEDVRQKRVTVHCSYERITDKIEIRIRCKERFGEAGMGNNASSDAETAWNLLEGWGILDLPMANEMNFDIGFEVETKVEKSSRELTCLETRVVRIPKPGRSA